jgi:hypothetical protein
VQHRHTQARAARSIMHTRMGAGSMHHAWAAPGGGSVWQARASQVACSNGSFMV